MMRKTGNEDYHLEFEEDLKEQDLKILTDGINDDAYDKRQLDPLRTFSIMLKSKDGTVCGGVTGFTFFGCLYTDMLFVKEHLRGQGFGTKLMLEAEKIGYFRNCTFATVNTMDFEALKFYQLLKYEIEFVREGFEKDSKMLMLRKKL